MNIQSQSNEKGRTFFIVVRTLAFGLMMVGLLIAIGHFFWGVLVYDTAADDTVKELSSRAVSISGQILNGQRDFSNNEFGLKTRKGYLTSAYMVDNNFFEITLSDIPKSICQRLLDKKWSMPTSVYVNGILDNYGPVLCKETNRISFEFSRDLSENIANSEKPKKHHCLSDEMCSGCEACREGRCQTSCTNTERCALTLNTQSVCCAPEKQAGGLCCSFIEDGQCCWGRGKCCPFDRPIYTTDGQCVDCYDPKPFAVGTSSDFDTCHKLCPNRVAFGQDNLCMLSICAPNQLIGQDGICYDCEQEGGVLTSEPECQKCPQRTYQNGFCRKNCPTGSIQDRTGKCISCLENTAMTPAVPTECTTRCPDRHLEDQLCVLNTCPENAMPDPEGNCIPCDTEKAVWDMTAETCAKCQNRLFLNGACELPCPDNTFRSSDGSCHACQDKEVYPVAPGSAECSKCPNRLFLNNYCFEQCALGQFRDALGSCHDCQDLESALILQTASCSLCPNRAVILKQNGKENIRYCALQYCPENYFRDSIGGCHNCLDTDSMTGIAQEACEQCPNRMWSPIENKCFIKPTCQAGEVLDTYGKCHTCDEAGSFRLNGYLENCNYCPNRYLFGPWCRTCPAQHGSLTTKETCQKCGGNWDNRVEKCY